MSKLEPVLKRATCFLALILMVIGLFIQPSLVGKEEPLLNLVSQINLREEQTALGASLPNTFRIQDVWADDDIAVVSAARYIHLIDYSDVEHPQLNTILISEPGEVEADDTDVDSWDAKLQDGYLYVGLQDSPNNYSLLVYDVSEFESPQLVGSLQSPNFVGVHNLFVKGPIAFLASIVENEGAGQRSGPVYLVDITVPELPVEIGLISDGETNEVIDRVHDVSVVAGRAYLAGTINGFWIVDLFNLQDATEFDYKVALHHDYEPLPSSNDQNNIFTHNIWPSESGEIIWTTDEEFGEGVRAFDISDPENVELIGVYSLGSGTSPHNVLVDGEIAYVAYYRQGLKLLQIDEIGGIVELATFDTSGGFPRGGLFSGNWGVYPFGEHLLASDTPGILSIFEKNLDPKNL